LQETDPEKWLLHRKLQCEGTKKRYPKCEKEKRRVDYLTTTPFDELGWESKRDRILIEQNNKCNKCHLSEWLGVKLPLDVDHINGDREDNSRNNLEAVCGNCHSITPTFRAKNKRKTKQVSDIELTTALKSTPSIRQGLIEVGLSPKGGNYVRANKLLERLDLENKSVSVIDVL
jgi:5-methylcytosine-specific restriction endonuclease McrA